MAELPDERAYQVAVKDGYYWSIYHNKYVTDDPTDNCVVYWKIKTKMNVAFFGTLKKTQDFIDKIREDEEIKYIYFCDVI